jgi:hypothetical protein
MSESESWEARKQRESFARWMIEHGFTTGHGDSIEDLFRELAWQIQEMRDKLTFTSRPEEQENQR